MLLFWEPLICLSHFLYCITSDATCSYLFRLKDHGQIKEVKKTIIHTVMATSLLIAVLHSVGPSLQGKSIKSIVSASEGTMMIDWKNILSDFLSLLNK